MSSLPRWAEALDRAGEFFSKAMEKVKESVWVQVLAAIYERIPQTLLSTSKRVAGWVGEELMQQFRLSREEAAVLLYFLTNPGLTPEQAKAVLARSGVQGERLQRLGEIYKALVQDRGYFRRLVWRSLGKHASEWNEEEVIVQIKSRLDEYRTIIAVIVPVMENTRDLLTMESPEEFGDWFDDQLSIAETRTSDKEVLGLVREVMEVRTQYPQLRSKMDRVMFELIRSLL